ncbi:Eco57I restriction-modification methylase domain-containing protein [Nostoc sp. 'Lobaria pulmonaria (5183) cyanobiont']|uniref:Eco57I restriction-modification methylase domain-containing protein n=1 Tax=Nostoc sp. 'Lobaria pulmonaria (5183) cyanobiont' TaxID=1618022 RepID=UPI000CF3490A|nr:DNA methyltransferase [Nostoc sp. 'Lobaria pulmonaria (5183) cyanobiont']AVH74017.1 restriction/modification DNA methylase [Nostoc sp. 'Lobaria pulmonaria (5183) cyanobiont']
MSLNFQRTRDLLSQFKFSDLFIEELGWSKPSRQKPETLKIENKTYQYQKIAELSGVAIFEVTAADGKIPEAKVRNDIYKEINKLIAENLLIFITAERTRSLWYWVKREGTKTSVRDHLYVKGQPGDLFLSKLGSLVIDITELEHGEPTVVEIAYKLQHGFDVEPVTKKFYKEFQEQHQKFLLFVKGIDNEIDRRWYTSVILNRLMFVYFLQRKGFIDNKDLNYLQNKLEQSQQKGENHFYGEFLKALFFESFAKPESERDLSVQKLVGKVKYLNGGLFLKHHIEEKYQISIVDEAFEQVLDLFGRYSWNLDDTPEGKDDEINPDVLGYIFEKYINQKAFGAYYTRPQITEYLCDRTIHKLIVDRVNDALSDKYKPFEDINELLIKLDTNICRSLMEDILPNLSILDPACGSGAFLVAAMKTLIQVYSAVIGTIELQGGQKLKDWLKTEKTEHLSIEYFIRKRILKDNLYGIDIMEEATEIAKLRLFLALVSSAHDVEELEPLPNIDFNIMAGNSLIGLIKVDDTAFDTVGNTKQGNLLQRLTADNYKAILEEKNKSIELYKKHAFIPGEEKLPGGEVGTHQDARLLNLRKSIDNLNKESQKKLNLLLLDEFSQKLGIKYEEVQLTGKSQKRVLKVEDIAALKPFHWGYHFDKVLERGGFDAIITNPPWEIFKPQAKEFFAQHNELVTKNKMDIKDFEKEQNKLLQNPIIASTWLEYQSQYPYVSAYYRSSEQYKNQISVVNGKKAGTDINLYKLFTEQCFNLLRSGGECGIVIPSGIYTDLGTKQLREMLFSQTKVTGLFCFENRKTIFEEVDSRFKFVVLTFAKGSTTTEFPSAFMRHDVQELQMFPSDDSLQINIDMVRKLSPDSLSVMEFKNEVDIRISEKMLHFPLLGEKIDGKWNFVLTREFDRGNDNNLFQLQKTGETLPLFVGKMFHQFNLTEESSPYWIKESIGRAILLGNKKDNNQILDYQRYRWVHRRIARNTDSRTLITTIAPRKVFCDNNSTTIDLNKSGISNIEMIFLCAICNAFILDWLLRQKVTTTLNMFYVYQLPVPRLTKNDRNFNDIVQRAAKLICTTPEFDELAQEVGLGSHQQGVTDETERAKLRAELDGMVAHLYGLTEDEFSYILTTFPIVNATVKEAALEAYRTFAPIFGDSQVAF